MPAVQVLFSKALQIPALFMSAVVFQVEAVSQIGSDCLPRGIEVARSRKEEPLFFNLSL